MHVNSLRGVRDRALAAKRFFCILEAPDGLSWNLLGTKFLGGMAPLNPPMTSGGFTAKHVSGVEMGAKRAASERERSGERGL